MSKPFSKKWWKKLSRDLDQAIGLKPKKKKKK